MWHYFDMALLSHSVSNECSEHTILFLAKLWFKYLIWEAAFKSKIWTHYSYISYIYNNRSRIIQTKHFQTSRVTRRPFVDCHTLCWRVTVIHHLEFRETVSLNLPFPEKLPFLLHVWLFCMCEATHPTDKSSTRYLELKKSF